MAYRGELIMQSDINIQKTCKRFIRLTEVLNRFPVSKSHWWEGVRTGKYPTSYKLSQGITVWLESDIEQLISQLIDSKQAA